ncbi:MAG: S-methyl-5'-thioadenosine phosphorylase [Methylacidiphilales bacterium]|nr:S-methyl-5'-thioadenosine phosphorylase [Candidatus Methylacidiphilales bacterium]
MENQPLIGIIGGSGVYKMGALSDVEEFQIPTPLGKTSDAIHVGNLHGRKVAFLARHGRHHTLLPSEIPHRANIWALKKLGVRWLISLSAVGSLKGKLRPGEFVIPLQFFDRTKLREEHTFFGQGIVAHISFGQPVCERLARILQESAKAAGAVCHWSGTYVNMEGPAFSTLAESEFHRTQGFDVVGMTNLAEAKLAREAEISYATVAMVTDYDCWHQTEQEVSVQEVIKILKQNAELAVRAVEQAVRRIPVDEKTSCHSALAHAIITPKEHWPQQRVEDLRPILAAYI